MLAITVLSLLSALVSIGSPCSADSDSSTQITQTNGPVHHETSPRSRSLAAQMGMTPEEAVFTKPRKMRSRYLNEMQLDENEEISPGNSTPEPDQQ